jgi:hypothetical protein
MDEGGEFSIVAYAKSIAAFITRRVEYFAGRAPPAGVVASASLARG